MSRCHSCYNVSRSGSTRDPSSCRANLLLRAPVPSRLVHARQEFRRPAAHLAGARRRTGDAAGSCRRKGASRTRASPGVRPGRRCKAACKAATRLPHASICLSTGVCSEIDETLRGHHHASFQKRPERSHHRLAPGQQAAARGHLPLARCCAGVERSLPAATRARARSRERWGALCLDPFLDTICKSKYKSLTIQFSETELTIYKFLLLLTAAVIRFHCSKFGSVDNNS